MWNAAAFDEGRAADEHLGYIRAMRPSLTSGSYSATSVSMRSRSACGVDGVISKPACLGAAAHFGVGQRAGEVAVQLRQHLRRRAGHRHQRGPGVHRHRRAAGLGQRRNVRVAGQALPGGHRQRPQPALGQQPGDGVHAEGGEVDLTQRPPRSSACRRP
jgi:hypothetical protein